MDRSCCCSNQPVKKGVVVLTMMMIGSNLNRSSLQRSASDVISNVSVNSDHVVHSEVTSIEADSTLC